MLRLSGKKRRKQGFTLSETMMVLALMAIVAAVAIPSIISYSRKMKQRELDDDARSIYMAAQHEIGTMETMGALEGSALQTGLVSVPDRYKNGTNPAEIAYYIYNKDTVAATPEGVLQGVVDSELTAHNYIVEYNPGTGDVLGVFYSDQVTFTKDDYIAQYNKVDSVYGKAAASGQANENGQLVGYYGAAPEKQELVPDALPVAAINIINKEKLVMEVNFDGGDIAGLYPVKISLSDGTHTAVLTADNAGINGGGAKTVFILDTLESAAPAAVSESLNGKTFEKSFREWAPDLTPGAQVTATVTVSDPKGIAQDTAATAVFNSLFADGSDETTAHIAYGRHLQNLNQCGLSSITNVVLDRTVDFKAKNASAPTGLSEKYEYWQDTYGARKFVSIGAAYGCTLNISNVTAVSGAQIRFIDVTGEGIFSSLTNASVSGLTLVSPKISSSAAAGTIAGKMDGGSLENCAVYVEAAAEGDNWSTPASDPYAQYCVMANGSAEGGFAGGLVGYTTAQPVSIKNSYAAVKVSGYAAGGLAGGVFGPLTVENSFSGGHTYNGTFEGTLAGSTAEYHLTDNISGAAAAGGLVGASAAGAEITLSGTVYSTCSVSGPSADTLIVGGTVHVTDSSSSKVYSLGTAYQAGAGKQYKSALTETLLKADGTSLVGSAADYRGALAFPSSSAKRYDTRVAATFTYPVVATLGAHRGDWPENVQGISGFFYWEQEGGAVKLHALYYDEEGVLQSKENLCKSAQDKASVTGYGYGSFSVGAEAETAFSGADAAALDAGDILASATVDEAAVKSVLMGADFLNDSSADIKVKLYDGTDTASGKGDVTAVVDGKTYTFAPDFYKLQAVDASGIRQGTGDVYGVRTVSQLKHIDNSRYLAAGNQFQQSHDIVQGVIKPIGSVSGDSFRGNYDGGGCYILDITYDAASGGPTGLFATTNGATLSNIIVTHMAPDPAAGVNPKDYFKNILSTAIPTYTPPSTISAFAAPGGLSSPLASLSAIASPFSALSAPSAIANPDSGIMVAAEPAIDQNGNYYTFVGSFSSERLQVNYSKLDVTPELFAKLREVNSFDPNAQLNVYPVGGWCHEPYVVVGDNGTVLGGSANSGIYTLSVSSLVNLMDQYNSDGTNCVIGFFGEKTNPEAGNITVTISHQHNYSEQKYDDNAHWLECSIGACEAVAPNSITQHTYYGGYKYFDEEYDLKKCDNCEYAIKEPHDFSQGENYEYGHGYHQCVHCWTQIQHNNLPYYDIGNGTHQAICPICGWRSEEEVHDGNTPCSKCQGRTAPASHEHNFDGAWIANETEHWKECTVEGCSVKSSWGTHQVETWTKISETQHQGVCVVCAAAVVRSHNNSGMQHDDDTHWTQCSDCGGKLNEAAHTKRYVNTNDPSGHQVRCDTCGWTITEAHTGGDSCSLCGYSEVTAPTPTPTPTPTSTPDPTPTPTPSVPVTGAPGVMGGIVGQASDTRIENCKVMDYALGSDAVHYETSGGAGGSGGYEFKGTYTLSQCTVDGAGTQSYSYITPGQPSLVPGYGCEMERIITSAYAAVAAGNPNYTYSLRVRLLDGATFDTAKVQGLKLYRIDGTDTHGSYQYISPLQGTYKEEGGDSRFEFTADALVTSFKNWPGIAPHLGDTVPCYAEVGIYAEMSAGLDFTLTDASINERESGISVPAAVLGGIAGTIQDGTVISGCETYLSFGSAAMAGGIAGQVLAGSGEILNCKANVQGFAGAVTRATRLGGILADATGASVSLQSNYAAFVNLTVDADNFPYVYAVGPGADASNIYVNDSGFATGKNTGSVTDGIPGEQPSGKDQIVFSDYIPYSPEHDKRKPDEEEGTE